MPSVDDINILSSFVEPPSNDNTPTISHTICSLFLHSVHVNYFSDKSTDGFKAKIIIIF